MNIAVDIGNTQTKIAFFDEKTLVSNTIVKGWVAGEILKIAGHNEVQHAIISSVIRLSEDDNKAISKAFKSCIFLDNATAVPIKIDYDTPDTLGTDRIAAAVGAMVNHPKEDLLVIDAGTCITADILEADGTYVGGSIAPGLKMRLQSMHTFTGKLPLIESIDEFPVIGKSTIESMLSGALHGMRFELNSRIKVIKKKYPGIKIILTGGDAHYLVNSLKSKIFAHPNLALEGLNKILRYNVSKDRP